MKKDAKMMVMGLVLAMVFCYAGSSLAGTTVGEDTASVTLDFQVNIQNYIEFRVGHLTTTSNISFQPLPIELSASTPITGVGGDVAAGTDSQVTVSLLSNTPSITITANTSGSGLVNGADSINWESITTAEIGGNVIAPPLLTNAGGEISSTILTGAQNINTIWEYSYTRLSSDSIPTVPGAYTGTVTYVASTP